MGRPRVEGDEIPESEKDGFSDLVSISDATVYKRCYLRFKISEFCSAYICVLGLAVGITEHEISYKYGISDV